MILARDSRPPVRSVHLGLGAFHRAHQAWYTAHASDGEGWGIAAYAGRRDELAHRLAAQDGLYTLVERGADGDRFEVVGSIARAHGAHDREAWLADLADSATAVVTLTVTERGHHTRPDGVLDLDDPAIRDDLDRLRRHAAPATAPGRLVDGLLARYRAEGSPIAIVPCDNVPGNGRLVAGVITALAERVDAGFATWVGDAVGVNSTSVDRITPTAPADLADLVAERTGHRDAVPVVTEPFSDWVLTDSFPAGRPDWASAGARIVADVEPWERRKLWMLNGAHTLLAALGIRIGLHTVAEAIGHPLLASAVEAFWDEAAPHLPAEGLSAYRQALRARFGNPRIEHSLAQIATDAELKVRLRIVPVALRERAAGRLGAAAAVAVAGWLCSRPDPDPRNAVRALSPELADDDAFVEQVLDQVARLSSALPLPESRTS